MIKGVKYIVIIILISLGTGSVKGNDTTDVKKRKWYLPSHVSLQYAGNIGFISGGVGFTYLKNILHTEFIYGHVPEKIGREDIGGEDIDILTLKQMITPFSINLTKYDVIIRPIQLGASFSYYFGDEYNRYNSSQYEDGYYWFMNGIRMSFNFGSEITATDLFKDDAMLSAMSIYYEFVVSDLSAYSYSTNLDNAKLKYILDLSIGLRFRF